MFHLRFQHVDNLQTMKSGMLHGYFGNVGQWRASYEFGGSNVISLLLLGASQFLEIRKVQLKELTWFHAERWCWCLMNTYEYYGSKKAAARPTSMVTYAWASGIGPAWVPGELQTWRSGGILQRQPGIMDPCQGHPLAALRPGKSVPWKTANQNLGIPSQIGSQLSTRPDKPGNSGPG